VEKGSIFAVKTVDQKSGSWGKYGSFSNSAYVVTIIKAEIKSVKFTSDNVYLNDYMQDYSGCGYTRYYQRGWVNGVTNEPVTHIGDSYVQLNVVVCVKPAGMPFSISGTCSKNYLTFSKNDPVSTGEDQVIPLVSNAPLPPAVGVLSESVSWQISGSNLNEPPVISGPHKIYVTWDLPLDANQWDVSKMTEKRANYACSVAAGATTEESVADKIWDNVALPETTIWDFYGTTGGWAMLDRQGGGACIQQARCMVDVANMVGLRAEEQTVCASTNASPGNCLQQQERQCLTHGYEQLFLDFHGGFGDPDYNRFEGCCQVAGHFYAITPKKKAINDYDMLKKLHDELGAIQVWVRRVNGTLTLCDQPGFVVDVP